MYFKADKTAPVIVRHYKGPGCKPVTVWKIKCKCALIQSHFIGIVKQWGVILKVVGPRSRWVAVVGADTPLFGREASAGGPRAFESAASAAH